MLDEEDFVDNSQKHANIVKNQTVYDDKTLGVQNNSFPVAH